MAVCSHWLTLSVSSLQRLVSPTSTAAGGKSKVKKKAGIKNGDDTFYFIASGPDNKFIQVYLANDKTQKSGYLIGLNEAVALGDHDFDSLFLMEFGGSLHRRSCRSSDVAMGQGFMSSLKGGHSREFEFQCQIIHAKKCDLANDAERKAFFSKFVSHGVDIMKKADAAKKISFTKYYCDTYDDDKHFDIQNPPRPMDHLFLDGHLAQIVEKYYPEVQPAELYNHLNGEAGNAPYVFSRGLDGKYSSTAIEMFGYPDDSVNPTSPPQVARKPFQPEQIVEERPKKRMKWAFVDGDFKEVEMTAEEIAAQDREAAS